MNRKFYQIIDDQARLLVEARAALVSCLAEPQSVAARRERQSMLLRTLRKVSEELKPRGMECESRKS